MPTAEGPPSVRCQAQVPLVQGLSLLDALMPTLGKGETWQAEEGEMRAPLGGHACQFCAEPHTYPSAHFSRASTPRSAICS